MVLAVLLIVSWKFSNIIYKCIKRFCQIKHAIDVFVFMYILVSRVTGRRKFDCYNQACLMKYLNRSQNWRQTWKKIRLLRWVITECVILFKTFKIKFRFTNKLNRIFWIGLLKCCCCFTERLLEENWEASWWRWEERPICGWNFCESSCQKRVGSCHKWVWF